MTISLYQYHYTQYYLTHSAGQSSGFGFRAKHTIREFSGSFYFASARKSTSCPGYTTWIQSALSMVISNQKSNLTINLFIFQKFAFRASQMGTKMLSFQIITELLQPSLWFFSQARSPVRSVINSPEYPNIQSKFPVMIISRSIQNFLPSIPLSLNKVTLPHHFFHPYYNDLTFIQGQSPLGSSVKQQKSNYQVVFLLIPAQSLLTQDEGQRVPHFTHKTLIFLEPQQDFFYQFFILIAQNPLQSGIYFLVYSTICYHVRLIAYYFRPNCLKISVKLTIDQWLFGQSSSDFLQYSKALSISST